MKRIVYTRPDGSVSIVVPAFGARLLEETEDEFVERIRYKDVPIDASDVQIVEASTIPSDRTFRDAWEQAVGVVSVNINKAREIHAGRIAESLVAEIDRIKVEERKERLKANGAKADQYAANLTALEALDQNVLSQRIRNAPNPTALAAVWPAKVPQ